MVQRSQNRKIGLLDVVIFADTDKIWHLKESYDPFFTFVIQSLLVFSVGLVWPLTTVETNA